MNKHISKRAIGLGIGLFLGNILMDLFNNTGINWIKAILAGVIAIGLYTLYEKLKK